MTGVVATQEMARSSVFYGWLLGIFIPSGKDFVSPHRPVSGCWRSWGRVHICVMASSDACLDRSSAASHELEKLILAGGLVPVSFCIFHITAPLAFSCMDRLSHLPLCLSQCLTLRLTPFSRTSSQARDRTQVSHIAGRFFTIWTTRKAQPKETFLFSFS